MKVYTSPFVVTIESNITVNKFNLVNATNPKALSLFEKTEDGVTVEIFRVTYDENFLNEVSDNGIGFALADGKDDLLKVNIMTTETIDEDFLKSEIAPIAIKLKKIEDQVEETYKTALKDQKEFLKSVVTYSIKGE